MAISQVQKNKSDYAGLITSQATAYSSNVTKGNLLVAFFGINTSSGAVLNTITDTLGNVWIRGGSTTWSNRNVYAYFCVANASGANTLTITPTASTTIGTAVFEYSGAPFFDMAINIQCSTTTPELDYVTPKNAVSLLMCFADVNGAAGITLTGGFTTQENLQSGGTTFTVIGDQITSALGNYRITVSYPSGSPTQLFGIIFSAVPNPIVAITGMVIGQSSSATASAVAAQPMSNTAGNTLVVGARNGGSVTQTAPTDTAGNTYHAVTAVVNGAVRVQFWYAFNIAAKVNNVITANWSSSAAVSPNFVGFEIQGLLSAADPHDTDAGATGTGGTSETLTTGSFTTSQVDEMMLGFATFNGTETGAPPVWTAGTGATLLTENPTQQSVGSNARFCATEVERLTAIVSGGTRSISYSSTFSTTPTIVIFAIVTFKAKQINKNQLMMVGCGT